MSFIELSGEQIPASRIEDQIHKFLDKIFNKRLQDYYSGKRQIIAIPLSEIETLFLDLGGYIVERPYEALSLIKTIAEQVYGKDSKEVQLFNDRTIAIYVDEGSSLSPKNVYSVTADLEGKLVLLEGVIRSVSSPFELAEAINFKCKRCGYELKKVQKIENVFLNKIEKPWKCPQCKFNKFEIASKDTIRARKIEIEELPETADALPVSLQGIVKGKLTEDFMFKKVLTPGSRVRITCIPHKTISPNASDSLFLDVLYVEPVASDTLFNVGISDEDILKFKQFASRPDILEYLASKVAPNIYGYDEIKKAIVLQIAGGVSKDKQRGDIHILLVGDPGTGKSTILKSVMDLAPKVGYYSATTVSKVGLTATVTKDASGNFILGAGVLPMYDKGLVAIDELDKANKEDLYGLHEAMEQGTISIAKANIQATLNARTSVLASANPKNQRFNITEPLITQISFQPALLSRFDLIFALRSDYNNMNIAQKVIENKMTDYVIPQEEKLFLKKFFAYVKGLKPVLSKEASQKLVWFFGKVQSQVSLIDNSSAIPITPRQLEAMLRLAEASAKVRMSPYVEEKDADISIALMTKFLNDFGYDPALGSYDLNKIYGIPSSKKELTEAVYQIIYNLQQERGYASYSEIIAKAQKELNLSPQKVNEMIELLNRSGMIIYSQQGGYKVVKEA